MVESKLTYEQMRKRRMEENKKRMEELNLKNLSQALKNSTMKQVKPRAPRKQSDLASVRRSSRVADKPKPNYTDSFKRGHARRNLLNGVYESDEERANAIERAEHLQSTLDSDDPSFVKPMLKSHVTKGLWLGLPEQFCKEHLPDKDTKIILVDEEEEEFETKYIADKTGLRGGWREFSIEHNLVDGDALVFHLVSPRELKVYIIRVCKSEDNEEIKEEKQAKRTRSSPRFSAA